MIIVLQSKKLHICFAGFFLFITTKIYSETITKGKSDTLKRFARKIDTLKRFARKSDTLKRFAQKSDTLKRLQNQRVTLKRLHRKKVTPLNDLNFGEFLVSDKNAPEFELYIKS